VVLPLGLVAKYADMVALHLQWGMHPAAAVPGRVGQSSLLNTVREQFCFDQSAGFRSEKEWAVLDRRVAGAVRAHFESHSRTGGSSRASSSIDVAVHLVFAAAVLVGLVFAAT